MYGFNIKYLKKTFFETSCPEPWDQRFVDDYHKDKLQKALVYYDSLESKLFKFFNEHDLKISSAMLVLLLDEKHGKLRKTGNKPASAHELDQELAAIKSLTDGLLKGDWDKTSPDSKSIIDVWLAAKLGHDLNEDFGYTRASLIDALHKKMRVMYGIDFEDEKHKAKHNHLYYKIITTAIFIEGLTHYRKFSIPEFEKRAKQKIPDQYIEQLKTDKAVKLNGFDNYVRHLTDLEGYLPSAYYNPIAYLRQGKTDEEVVVTAYGGNARIGVNWNHYILSVASHLHIAELKSSDRINNHSTILGIHKTLKKYNGDIDSTRHIFNDTGFYQICERLHSDMEGKPFMQLLLSEQKMLKLLLSLNEITAQNHPDANIEGGKIFDAEIMGQWHILNTTPYYFSKYFNDDAEGPSALEAFKGVPAQSHPVVQFFVHLYEKINILNDQNMRNVFIALFNSMVEHGDSDLVTDIANSTFNSDLKYPEALKPL